MQRFSKQTKNLNPYLNHCSVCNKTFHKLCLFNEHMGGKKHLKKMAQTPKSEEELLEELKTNAPYWFSADITSSDVASPWSKEELSTLELKFRYTTLHPSTMMNDLTGHQKARMWRYCRDAIGKGTYSEIATILAAVDSEEDGHLRVKELFESFETFRVIENLIVSAHRTCEQTLIKPVDKVVEIACGHGLVSLLLAYRFPDIQFCLYDLEKRITFELYIKYFEQYGQKLKQNEKVLPNIKFYECDMRLAESVVTERSMVIAIHGCNDVNQVSIEMAQAKQASWVVMPCCIHKDLYLGQQCVFQLEDDERDVRHSIMCGIIAQRYGAQAVTEIDRRITNRSIVIAGGIATQSASPGDEQDALDAFSHDAGSKVSEHKDKKLKSARLIMH